MKKIIILLALTSISAFADGCKIYVGETYFNSRNIPSELREIKHAVESKGHIYVSEKEDADFSIVTQTSSSRNWAYNTSTADLVLIDAFDRELQNRNYSRHASLNILRRNSEDNGSQLLRRVKKVVKKMISDLDC